MKKNYFIVILLLVLVSGNAFSQLSNFQLKLQQLDQKKAEGKATGQEQLVNPNAVSNFRVTPPSPHTASSSACNCWIPRDASWVICPFDGSGGSGGPGVAPQYRNDDWTTPLITLPFNLCFYGQTVTQVYINNNGNVSIGTPYSTFTANSFPDPAYVMIAPFWGDVDTRGAASGLVYYKMTPTYLIVQWDNVGYYSSYTDKLNTFQLIITDGNDPILGAGNNVSFCYQDMQWTTGDASSGTNGFGGTPATVGVNQGNGIDYVQFGRFDQPGGAYDGPFGSNDGIDWLDNQNFTFSFCTSNANIPPVLNSLNVCDTLRLCQNQTLSLTANYYSPEQGQSTFITLNPGTMTGINVLSNTPGNTATINFTLTGLASNVGTRIFQLQAQDDGVPVGITTNEIVVIVYPAPIAGFTFLPASPIQINTPVTFTNTSNPGNLYTWNFGDGTPTTTVGSPVHSFTTPGTYNVMLVALRPPNGCTDTVIQQVVINACATSTFTTTNVCIGNPSTITYTGLAGPAAGYNWNFNGGTVLSGSGQGPYSVLWNTPGSYNVSLDVTENGCTSAATVVPATIYPIPVASYSAIPSLCIGATTNVNFNGIAGGTATYNWNFNGATVNSGSAAGPYNVQWNAAGNYNVTLTVTENGCSNTTSSNVSINPIPTATFNATPAVCANDPIAVNYTGTGTAGGTYNWNFNGATINSGSGSGPYTISFSTGGAYNVSLTVTENGCTSTPLAQAVNITDFPVPSISSMPSLCVNAANVISYSGSALGTAAYTWNWNGGTVASGSGAGPYSVSWATPGNYNVNVSVNQNGCIASTSVPIVVNAIPTSNFIITPAACANTPVNASYTGTGTAGATYTWDFTGATVVSGSGGGPYTLNYASGGAYNVSLTVSENGCVGAPINLPVSITNAPIATFTATPSLCINAANTISFTGSVIMTALVNWNFDGGTVISGTGTGPYQISWPTPGNYNVSLSIDQNGCVASSSIPVTVYNIPTSDFTITPSACTSDPININYIGTGTPGSTYNWSFTGATVNSGTGVGPYVLNYASGGAYTVSLTVSENGCVGAPINLPVNITQVPTASITATPSLCVNADNNIIFTGTALPMATYNWNFNGGNIASGSSGGPYTINWSTPGTYNVSVSVDQNGCIAQTSFPVTVFAIPTSDFNITPAVCLGNTVTVNYTGSGTVNSNYNWNFNGGAIVSGTGSGPYTLQYNNPGNNPVTLVVDENGCVSTVMLQQTTINPIPTVEAGNNAIVCSGVLVSVGDPNPVAGAIYQWSPATYLANANSPSTTVTLVNSTITTQQIDYTLLVTDANGCTNSDMVRVSAYPQPVVNFNNQGQQCLDNNNFIFAAIANIPSGMNYSWSFPGGNPASSTQSSQDVTYAATGTYQITLNADYNGCIAPVYTDTVRVNEMPVSDFIPQVFNGCQPLTVPFSNLSIGFGNSYSWNFFDNTPINYSDNPTHVFNTPGTFSVSLVASNVFGCKANITYPDIITVYPEAVARFTPNPSVANVLAPAFQFQNYSTNSATYSWDFGDGDSAFIRNPSHSYVDTGSYNVMLIVTSPDGCIDTIAGVVRVEDNFAFYIPNAFSPNGDGVNDSFRGFGVAIRAFSMSIYNRWGELIYRTNDYNQPWDGKVKDTVQNDVYVYRIEVVDHHEEKHVYLGNVSVVR